MPVPSTGAIQEMSPPVRLVAVLQRTAGRGRSAEEHSATQKEVPIRGRQGERRILPHHVPLELDDHQLAMRALRFMISGWCFFFLHQSPPLLTEWNQCAQLCLSQGRQIPGCCGDQRVRMCNSHGWPRTPEFLYNLTHLSPYCGTIVIQSAIKFNCPTKAGTYTLLFRMAW